VQQQMQDAGIRAVESVKSSVGEAAQAAQRNLVRSVQEQADATQRRLVESVQQTMDSTAMRIQSFPQEVLNGAAGFLSDRASEALEKVRVDTVVAVAEVAGAPGVLAGKVQGVAQRRADEIVEAIVSTPSSVARAVGSSLWWLRASVVGSVQAFPGVATSWVKGRVQDAADDTDRLVAEIRSGPSVLVAKVLPPRRNTAERDSPQTKGDVAR